MEPLNGLDGAQALRVYTGLGALDARFDGRRVAAAVRSRAGRAKLLASISVARVRLLIRPHRMLARPLARVRSRAARRAGTRTRLARSGGSDRPHLPRPPAGGCERLSDRLSASHGASAEVG